MIQKSLEDAGVLERAAQSGAVEIWEIVLEEIRGQGLLQEVWRDESNGGRLHTAPPSTGWFVFSGVRSSQL